MTEERIEEREIPQILCPPEREFPEETEGLTTCDATALALQKAREDGVRTAWDRAQVMRERILYDMAMRRELRV